MQYNKTIRKKDNGYQVIISYKIGNKWKQKSKQGFSKVSDAKLYGDELVQQLKKTITNPLDDSIKNISLRDFYNIYKNDNEKRVAYNTILTYNNAINAFSNILDMPLVEITHIDIQKCLNQMAYSNRTKNIYTQTLKVVLNYAISPYRIIQTSPAQDIKSLKINTKHELSVFSEEECNALLSSLKNKRKEYYIACAIARYTGARYGEVIGLSWDDIDLKNATISINKQFARISNDKYGLKHTKTQNSIRNVPIPPILVAILKEYQKESPISLFTLKTANTSSINLCIQTVVPDKTFHDLRHTYATTLLANGVDIKTVSILLGDTTEMVMKVYVHYTEEMEKKAAHHVSKIFG